MKKLIILLTIICLTACRTADRAIVSTSDKFKEYDYAAITEITDTGRLGTLIDVENKLCSALMNIAKLELVNVDQIESLPDAKKQKLLLVRYVGHQDNAEATVDIYFNSYLTNKEIAHCNGVYNLGLSKEYDARAAMHRAFTEMTK